MRIGTNMSAVIAAGYLNKSEKSMQLSLGKLSSGLKINNSKDDPAGMAISQKMKAQIKGLSRASMNASDGISVVQTAEGALSEVEAMLQRMNELAVQGANETHTDEDRKNMNNEIKALMAEIDRISTDTEFNSTKLLNGDLQRRTYATTYDASGEKHLESNIDASYMTSEVEAGRYGISVDANGVGSFLLGDDGNRIGFSDTATITTTDNKILVNDLNGFKMEFTINPEESFSGDVTFEVWNIGTMPIQIGANEGQLLDICIPEISSKSLNIDSLKYDTSDDCGNSITSINEAISRVSKVRSEIGACQNRLERSVSSLDVTEENMTAALSRMTDVDMAEEMTNYTQYNVMQQAGVSMVAQANQLPEKVLQLLQ